MDNTSTPAVLNDSGCKPRDRAVMFWNPWVKHACLSMFRGAFSRYCRSLIPLIVYYPTRRDLSGIGKRNEEASTEGNGLILAQFLLPLPVSGSSLLMIIHSRGLHVTCLETVLHRFRESRCYSIRKYRTNYWVITSGGKPFFKASHMFWFH